MRSSPESRGLTPVHMEQGFFYLVDTRVDALPTYETVCSSTRRGYTCSSMRTHVGA
jgi:hypothetical protein